MTSIVMANSSNLGSRHPLEKTERVLSEISEAKNVSSAIIVSYCWLLSVPSKIFQDEDLVGKLKRLDLSHNHITSLPAMMSHMLNLREIWLSYNPISVYPQCLLACKKLEVIDISNTLIAEVPTYVIDYSHLHTLDWRDTPLEGNLQNQYQVGTNDLKKLQVVMRNINIRNKASEALRELLYSQIYLLDVDKSYSKDTIQMFVEQLSSEFDNLEDYESFSRRPIKFIPAKVDDIVPEVSAKKAKVLFYEMKREIDRKRLAADLEIKIRGQYYDQIERSEVTTLIDSIYLAVHSLEDMQFLVQYAHLVLPKTHVGATGNVVWDNICALQDELIQKRESAIMVLAKALTALYPEQKPEVLLALARESNSHPIVKKERFATQKELVKMAQLAGDCAKVFPPDFASVNVNEVLLQAKESIFKA